MRFLWLLLLPLVWLPLLALLLLVAPGVPWYGWLVGVGFWVLFRRRRAAQDAPGPDLGAVDTNGPRWSPTGRGGWL